MNNDTEKREIYLSNKFIKYTNENYDITIIEIKKEDNIKHFLDSDEKIFNNFNNEYINESIYILHYPLGKDINVSYGIIEKVENNYIFGHLCCTEGGSSGAPILNTLYNKVIELYLDARKSTQHNRGLFLKYAIIDFYNYINNMSLISFNKKYNLKLEMNLNELQFVESNFGNIILKDLCLINFKNLKILQMKFNKI